MTHISLYYNIGYYAIIFTIACFYFAAIYRKYNLSIGFSLFLLLVVGIYIGCRPIDVGTDTEHYLIGFNNTDKNDYSEFGSDPVFYLFRSFFSNYLNFRLFLIIVEFIILFALYDFSKRVMNKSIQLFPLLLFVLSSSFYYNLQTNIIRSGIAISLVLVYSIYLYENKPFKGIGYLLIALGCHFSIVLPLLIMVIVRINNINLKYYYILFAICVVASYFNIGVHSLFSSGDIEFNKAEKYLSLIDNTTYKIGFRPTFVLFNLFFLIVFHYLIKGSDLLMYYQKYYVVSSCVFFMFFGIPFSDRIGIFSWIIIPFILYLGIQNRFVINRKMVSLLSFCGYFIISFIISPK